MASEPAIGGTFAWRFIPTFDSSSQYVERMTTEQEPLELARGTVGPSGPVVVLMVAGSVALGVAWGTLFRQIDPEVNVFGLFVLSLHIPGLVIVFAVLYLVAEMRARRVLCAVRVLQHQASRYGLDVRVWQERPGWASVDPQRFRVGDGRLWLDDVWWDASVVTVHRESISRWRRGVSMTVAGHQLWLSAVPKTDPAANALWGTIAIDRAFAEAVDAALRPMRSAQLSRDENS